MYVCQQYEHTMPRDRRLSRQESRLTTPPAQSHQSLRYTFDKALTVLRFLGTQGLQFFTNMYFSRTPMFHLPVGWVPYPAEWVLSFPRAPVGSISINVWSMACAAVIGLVSEGLLGVWTLGKGEVVVGEGKGEKVKMEGMGMAVGGRQGEKKEL